MRRKNVQLLLDFILKHENTFKIPSHQSELYNIITKEQMGRNHMKIMAKRKKTELASKRMIDITTAIGIPMESILPYDITQENYLSDQNGLIKKAQKFL